MFCGIISPGSDIMDISLLPADNYQVINKSIITNEDLKIINMLYLPIIGSLPVTLYHTLLSDLDNQQLISDTLNHSHLVANLHVSINELLDSRHVLEGIGLLKTYYKEGSVNSYLYELYSPVTSHEFFTHPIFNIVLYNNVGKKEYERLINCFKVPKLNKEGYCEITRKFNEVFKTVPYTSFDIYKDNIRKHNHLKLDIDSDFDMNFLIENMPKSINRKIFTKDLQELIIQLATLYDIDETKMQMIIKSCINEKGGVNRDELRKVCRNHFQFDHQGLLPTIIEHTQPEYLRKPLGENTKMAKMIYTFETTSPYDFLKSKHKDAEPVKRDVKLLEDLIVDYKLKPGVVNVLVDYVLKTNDNKLTRTLVETIAGQWKRKNIETVEDAMDIARKNHAGVNKNKLATNKTSKDKVLPVWFDKNIEATSASDEEREKIEELLKEYK